MNAIENETGWVSASYTRQSAWANRVSDLRYHGAVSLSFILWRVDFAVSVSRRWRNKRGSAYSGYWRAILTHRFRAAGVSELDTIKPSDKSVFAPTCAELNRHREFGGTLRSQAAELHALVLEHRQARASGKKASEAKSTFLAAMSREIRTPLYGILGTNFNCWPIEAARMANYRDDLQAINDSGESLLAVLTI